MHRPTAAPVVRCAPPALSRRRLRRCAGPTPIEFRVAALGVPAPVARPDEAESPQRGCIPDALAGRGVTQNVPRGQPHPHLNLMAARKRGPIRKGRPPRPINSAIGAAAEYVGQAEAF